MSSKLFSPDSCRGVVLKNRVGVSPMCQYSANDGVPNIWHVVHLGSRAVGGAGLVMVEAAAVAPDARISDKDIGIWNSAQVDQFRQITEFAKSQGAVPAIQLAHSGRKGSTQVPWLGRKAVQVHEGGWSTVAPTSTPFNDEYTVPRELTVPHMHRAPAESTDAAQRSLAAGFDVVALHMGHGYLLN